MIDNARQDRRREARGLGDEIAARLAVLAWRAHALAKDVLLGDDGEIIEQEAAFKAETA